MKAQIDIENSKTGLVDTINVKVIKCDKDNEIIFDISLLNDKELKLLKDAINQELQYTDIELFFIGYSNIPEFGPDYNYELIENKLILKYIKKNTKIHIEEKNEDWTLNYGEEFNSLVQDFLKTNYKYLLIYESNGLKSKYYKNKPKDSIFMTLFFNKNYKKIALFKRNKEISNNLRDNLEYINSYSED